MKNEAVERWIESAESDLELALTGRRSKKIQYVTLCFHSQQAVEKSLKAILIYLDKEYPLTHNIKILFSLIEDTGMEIPGIIHAADDFSKYVIWRYPEDVFEIEVEEYNHSIQIASKTIEWAKSILFKNQDKLF